MSDKNHFDALLEMPSNRFALAAARAVASCPDGIYNPLWIYGPSGTGKTTILNILEDVLRTGHPRLLPLRMQMEQFAGELVSAFAALNPDSFRKPCIQADAILLDHAECLYGKPHTQEQIGLLLAQAVHQRHQVVLVSSCPPQALGNLLGTLSHRCEYLLTADIQNPDPMDRIRYARDLAQQAGLELSNNAFIRIAAGTRNFSQLQCAITHIAARRDLLDQDEAELMKALEQLLSGRVTA